MKNEPKSIASEAMKRNIPSTVELTRELWFAIGGPWWALGVRAHACTSVADAARLDDDVLDRHLRLAREPPDEVAAQPAEPRCSGKVETMISSTRSSRTACIAAVNGSGWATWPCASIPSAAQLRQRPPQAPLGLGMRALLRVALRAR